MEIYSKTMGSSMKRLFEQYAPPIFLLITHIRLTMISHVEGISKNPRVDIDAVKKITYLHEFDQ